MITTPNNQAGQKNDETVILPENLTLEWVEHQKKYRLRPIRNLYLDFSPTKKIDSAGIAYIRMLYARYHAVGKSVLLTNISVEHLSLLQAAGEYRKEVQGTRQRSLFLYAGDNAISFFNQLVISLSVLVEMLYWGTIGIFKKQDFKRGALGEQMYLLGYKAIGIVGLLSFLIGIVLSLQTAIQLRTFGAGIFIAPLIGITMVREMGPLLTAIILAGRTGSATTAEIATMGVNEEIDALKTMGINPIQYVVVPKFWAISFTMPLLSILATATGIIGGYLIALTYLDISSSLFFGELAKYLTIKDVRAGIIKSIVFSWLIIWVGAFYGLRVHGGAEAVGKETTGSVVTGIFIIIIADALFSFVL